MAAFAPRRSVYSSVAKSPARSECFLESTGKGGLGVIANHGGDLGEGGTGLPQLVRGDLHAPIAEVAHWGDADQPGEAVVQRRARQADLAAIDVE